MRLIDIDDERFLDILFDEACVEGKQAERIKNELEKIVSFDTEKVVEQLEESKTISVDIGFGTIIRTLRKDVVLEIVKGGGENEIN